jgi:hypothetical protein
MINYYFFIYLGHRNIALSFPYRPSLRFEEKLSALFLNAYTYKIQTLNYATMKKNLYTLMF